VEKTVKDMRGKKAVGNHDVSGDVMKIWGEDGLRIKTQRFINIHEPGV
jgi:beta-lactamase class D